MRTYRADTDLKAILLFTMKLRIEFFHGFQVKPRPYWLKDWGRVA